MTQLWNNFWLKEAPPHALAIVRICLGLFLLVYASTYALHITLLFSNEGLTLPLYFAAPSPTTAYLMYAVSILMLLGFTVGAYFRVCAVACFFLGLYYWQLQLHMFPSSYNRILCFTLLVLMCSGANKTFSYDTKRTLGSWTAWEPTSVLAGRLICMQISLTFIGVSLQKWMLPAWSTGEILTYTFIGRWSTLLSGVITRLNLPVEFYDFVILTVKVLQPLAGIGVWIARFRLASILFIHSFLILVALLLGIWWFIFLIPACILFFPPEKIYAYLKEKHVL
ncbi:hypothetical protein HOL63_03185 [Candidatus Peregrinibacteria bacterium]|jgi:hypothetical protein|nr:hypothetical protein [Candidatus Peregrinibacteria bacterium]MBT7338061.1 hypothetical protein [Candidatus Peregrinibacteria bacterium]